MNKIYYYVVIIICVAVIGFITFEIFSPETQESLSIDSATNIGYEDEAVIEDGTTKTPTSGISTPEDKSTNSSQSVQAEPIVNTTKTAPTPIKTTPAPVATQIKTKVDVHGVDLYTLKQGVTIINKTDPVEIRIVYIRNGSAVEYNMTVPADSRTREGAKYSSITYLKSPIDKYGTDLSQLKEGETIINKTVYNETEITYTRSGNTVVTRVSTKNLSGSGNSTTTIELPI